MTSLALRRGPVEAAGGVDDEVIGGIDPCGVDVEIFGGSDGFGAAAPFARNNDGGPTNDFNESSISSPDFCATAGLATFCFVGFAASAVGSLALGVGRLSGSARLAFSAFGSDVGPAAGGSGSVSVFAVTATACGNFSATGCGSAVVVVCSATCTGSSFGALEPGAGPATHLAVFRPSTNLPWNVPLSSIFTI